MGRFLAFAVLVVLLAAGLLAHLHGGNLLDLHHLGVVPSASTLSTAVRPFSNCNGVPSPC